MRALCYIEYDEDVVFLWTEDIMFWTVDTHIAD